jgi:hypothetical protein
MRPYVYRIINGERVFTFISIGIETESCVVVLAGLSEGEGVHVVS